MQALKIAGFASIGGALIAKIYDKRELDRKQAQVDALQIRVRELRAEVDHFWSQY
jgi:hypothetical protein